MKPAQGFLTDDGSFFDNAYDAAFYDALHALTFSATVNGIDPEKLIRAIDSNQVEIARYLHAKSQKDSADYDRQRSNGSAAPADDHPDDGYAKAVNASVFEQPAYVDEPVPNVGRGIFSEAIRDNGPVNGSRSGRSDASSVCSDQNMATAYQDEFTKTCIERGKKDIQWFRSVVEGIEESV